jgi:hypothetical protein
MTQASTLQAFLQVLADHALLGRLFFASMEMAVLAGIVWLIIRIRRRMSPRLCSILWLLVMAKAFVALAIGAPLAIIRISPPEPEPIAVAYEPTFNYEHTVTSFEPEAVLPLVTVEPGPMEPAPPAGWSFSWKWSAAETISGAWIIGAILVGLYAALNRVRLHRLVSRAMPAPAGIIERYNAAVGRSHGGRQGNGRNRRNWPATASWSAQNPKRRTMQASCTRYWRKSMADARAWPWAGCSPLGHRLAAVSPRSSATRSNGLPASASPLRSAS